MPHNSEVNMEEDVSAEIMTTLSAALVMCPKFNFGKLMELSTEINGDKNKTVFADIISLAFLNFLEMNDAAETLSGENIAASAGYSALNLDKKESLAWFIRFLTVMNPAIIATLSQTLMSVVNGLMVQNTRLADADRMHKVRTKLDRFVKSGEVTKRTDKLLEAKPAAERNSRKEVSNLGLIGWTRSNKTPKRRESSASSVSSSSKQVKPKKSAMKEKGKQKKEELDVTDTTDNMNLRDYLNNLEIDDENVAPEDSISQVSSANQKLKKEETVKELPVLSALRRKVSIRPDDSVISD